MFFIWLLSLGLALEFPKHSYIFISEEMTQDDIDVFKNGYIANIDNICSEEEGEEAKLMSDEWIEQCHASFKALDKMIASTNSEINAKLSSVPSDNKFLYIMGPFSSEVDLNKLKSQMVVVVNTFDFFGYARTLESYKKLMMHSLTTMAKTKLDVNQDNYKKMVENKNHKVDDRTNDYYGETCEREYLESISLVGNIKDKVSFLIIKNAELKVVTSELNVNSVYFEDCSVLHRDSLKVKSNHIVSHFLSHLDIMDAKSQLGINQYGLVFDQDYGERPIITYKNEEWEIDGSGKRIFKVPYSVAKTFNLLSIPAEFEVNLEEGVSLSSYNALNLTVNDVFNFYGPGYIQEEKPKIVIKGNGWDNIAKIDRPKITLVYDNTKYDYDDSNEIFNVDKVTAGQTTDPSEKPPKKNKTGMIVGIVFAVVIVIVIVVVVVVIVIRKKKAAQDSASQQEDQ